MHSKDPLTDTGFQFSFLQFYSSVTDEFIAIYDLKKDRYVYVNEPGAVMMGFLNANEFLNAADFDFRKEKISDVAQAKVIDIIDKNGSYAEEIICRTLSGKEFYASLLIHNYSDKGNNFHLVRIRDINKFKKNDLVFLQEKKRFEALFNHATLGIVLADKTGQIVLANQFACNQFGYSCPVEMNALKVENLIPQRIKEKHVKLREQYNEAPQPRSMGAGRDLFRLKKDGTEFPVEISLSTFQNEEGFFGIAFIIDISKRKEIENAIVHQAKEMEKINAQIEKLNNELEGKVEARTKQLHSAMKQLEISKDELTKALSNEKELGDMKSRFVSMASHEFRTPLSTILSSASLVAKYTHGDEQEKRDKHIHRIKSSVNNLTDILNDFLSLGKMEDGKISVNHIDISIKKHLSQLIAEMQVHAKKGQIIFYSHTGEEVVNTDPALLRNAITNLLSNAIKFSPENKPIEVSSLVDKNELIIIVQDSGIGVSEEDQKHLFERFFRAHNATNIQGTGLGLHIVAKYIELLEGEIEFSSELEKGSKFIIKLKI